MSVIYSYTGLTSDPSSATNSVLKQIKSGAYEVISSDGDFWIVELDTPYQGITYVGFASETSFSGGSNSPPSGDVYGFAVFDSNVNLLYEVNGIGGLNLSVSSMISNPSLIAGGDDVLFGSAATDLYSGAAGDDALLGAGGNDTLDGGAGDDSISGGAGDDRLSGGSGIDLISYADVMGPVQVSLQNQGVWQSTGAGGVDFLTGFEKLEGSGYDDILRGDGLANTIYGFEGDDLVYGGAGNDTVYGDDGNDKLFGGGGNDIIDGGNNFYDRDIVSYADASRGVTVNLAISSPQNTLGGGTDTLVSIEGVEGTSFDDVLTADGADQVAFLLGGGGNDSLRVLADHDIYVDGGSGTDTLSFRNLTSGVSVDLNSDGSGSAGSLFSFAHIEIVDGSNYADTFNGNAGADTIFGRSGDDAINGGGNKDRINGGYGNDTIDGGYNIDLLSYADAPRIVTVDLSITTAQNTGYGTDTITNIEDLEGSAYGDTLTGSGVANTIYGLAGNDVIDGGAGVDTMVGGSGNDAYVVDDAGDVVTEASGGGADEVRTVLASYTLAAEVENLVFTGAGAFSGTGNTLSNVIMGGADADALDGAAGNDTLDGGVGADSMTGGTGNDTFIVDDAGDVVTEAAGAGAGVDTIRTALLAFDLSVSGANVENLVYTGSGNFTGTGNGISNVIVGGAGDDVLDGAGGAFDKVSYMGASAGVVVSLGISGSQNTIGAGSDTLSNFEQLEGSGFNDTLTGSNADDRLFGLAGNDTLDGGLGVDRLDGGAGNDTYIVNLISDVVIEAVNAGTDLVQSTASYTLSANVENLTLMGAATINGSGNVSNNILRGNGGNNSLYGNAGNDTLVGNAGDDKLYGGAGADNLYGGAGHDAFVLNTAIGAGQIDRFSDFNVADDAIWLENAIFIKLAAGSLSANSFRVGSAAVDANDYIVYNKTTGALYYDADGGYAGKAVQIATLSANLALTAQDFLVT